MSDWGPEVDDVKMAWGVFLMVVAIGSAVALFTIFGLALAALLS